MGPHVHFMIRPVKESDNMLLAAVVRKVFEEYDAPRQGTVFSDPTTDDLYGLFRAPGSVLWVAVTENGPSGCCGVYPTRGLPDGCAELVKFYLCSEVRGLGIGRALMEKCIRSAYDLGYEQLYLESLPHFARALRMYEKQGFVRLEKPLGQSGHPACNIWMIRELKNTSA